LASLKDEWHPKFKESRLVFILLRSQVFKAFLKLVDLEESRLVFILLRSWVLDAFIKFIGLF
jgi:hypothetical protein